MKESNLNDIFFGESEPLSVRAERHLKDLSVGPQLVDDASRDERDEVDLPVLVDGDQEDAIRRQRQRREVETALHRECRRFVILQVVNCKWLDSN